jgi:DNA mismatch endonuclease (patch repair protein)
MPGNPDIVYTRWKVAIFVDGVFWHGRPDYFQFGTKGEYWDQKIAGNIERDAKVNRALSDLDWEVLRFWDVDIMADPSPAVCAIAEALKSRGRDVTV